MTATATNTRTPAQALGFDSLEQEAVLDRLALEGEVPSWLGGSLIRMGPAKFEVGEQRMRHWFDGLAMLHRFSFAAGEVSYGNRFLESRAYRGAEEKGQITYGEFATDPCRSLFKRVQALFTPTAMPDNANINVTRLGERFIAMTETPLPIEFDPETLATAEVRPFRAPGHLTTAHPHMDRGSGALLNYAAKLGARNSYRFFEVDAQATEPRVIASMPVREPAYMHSFGLTERFFVLVEFPLLVNPLRMAVAGKPYIENYRWRPEQGTRFTLVDRGSGEVGGRFETEACFAFHHVNAYEQGDDVVVDICAYPDATLVEDLYLDRLRAGKPIAAGELTRFRLGLKTKTVNRERLSEGSLDLPRINYRAHNARPHRYVWGNGLGESGWIEKIVKVDVDSGAELTWSAPGCFPSEPIFIAAPEERGEDDGVLVSVVLDSEHSSSFLLVLDAGTHKELARASVPHHIPFGFHGHFSSA